MVFWFIHRIRKYKIVSNYYFTLTFHLSSHGVSSSHNKTIFLVLIFSNKKKIFKIYLFFNENKKNYFKLCKGIIVIFHSHSCYYHTLECKQIIIPILNSFIQTLEMEWTNSFPLGMKQNIHFLFLFHVPNTPKVMKNLIFSFAFNFHSIPPIKLWAVFHFFYF